jgi:recombination protein RecA
MAGAKKSTDEKKDVFQEKLKVLETRYGKGSIVLGKDVSEELEVVSTGSIAWNLATKCGGTPVGKLIEYQGMESSGKSTGSLHTIAEFQKAYPDDEIVLCDYEQSFDRTYATTIGVNVDKLTILQPENLEDGYNMIQDLIETGKVRLAVIDSHTAGMPKKVVEGDTGDASIGLQARINSQALGKIKPILKANRCTMIGISQIRQDIGSMGEVNKSTGGLAWKFYCDMRVKFAKVQTDKVNESNKTEISIIKNKCASPWGKATLYIDWGVGISKMQELLDMGSELKLINKAGSWYTIGDQKIQGDDAAVQFLKDNEEFATELHHNIMQLISPDSVTIEK